MTLDDAITKIPADWTTWSLHSAGGRQRFICYLAKMGDKGERHICGNGITPSDAVLNAVSKANS